MCCVNRTRTLFWLLPCVLLAAGAAHGQTMYYVNDDGTNTACTGWGDACSGEPSVCGMDCNDNGIPDECCCQLLDESVSVALSDLSAKPSGVAVADDFVAQGTSIGTVSVWGVYVDRRKPMGQHGCSADVTDNFRVTLYADGDGTPGTVVATSLVSSLTRDYEPNTPYERVYFSLTGEGMFAYQLTLDTAITGLTPGQTYWLEVVNNTDWPEGNTCDWYWSNVETRGNNHCAAATENGYLAGGVRATDLAFCLDMNIEAPVAPTAPCCTCPDAGAMCTTEMLAVCDGTWDLESPDCASVTCPITAPGDDCATDVIPVGGEQVLLEFDTYCSTTDGPTPMDMEHGFRYAVGYDIWYAYTASCTGKMTVSLCASGSNEDGGISGGDFSGGGFDSFIVLYHDRDSPSQCPCPEDAGFQQVGVANDEGCNWPLGYGPGILEQFVLPGECWTIRVGGITDLFVTPKGKGILEVRCDPGGPDCDNDGLPNPLETDPLQQDCDNDGLCNGCEIDCGVPTGPCNVLGCGESMDCTDNKIPDECEDDCNTNGQADSCDIAQGVSQDTNGNDVPDECDKGACCYTWDAYFMCVETTEQLCQDDWGAYGGTFLGLDTQCPTESVMLARHDGVVVVHVTEPAQQCGGGGQASRRVAGFPIDAWMSAEDAVMCHRFDVEPDSPPIPADFFDPGSDPFDGVVCLEGNPLGPTEYGDFGDADTLVRRSGDPFDRCAIIDLPAVADPVEAEVVALSLVSVEPITVTYNGGQNPELWDVAVNLSEVELPPEAVGTVTAVKTHCNGGTYSSELYVQPKFTFTKVADPGEVRILDTGIAEIPYVTLTQDGNAPWTMDVSETLGLSSPIVTDFHPGVEDPDPTLDCDCNGNLVRDKCDIEAATRQDCNANAIPDECDIADGASEDCQPNGAPDECDVIDGTSADCQSNGVPDECDIASGGSDDGNGDGIPDECCRSVWPPWPIPDNVAKNRYLSLRPGNAGERTSLRVTVRSMPPGLEDHEGCQCWVGEPQQVSENSGKINHEPGWPDFMSANLQGTPLCMDWSTVGTLHVTDDDIIPSAVYDVQAINCACNFDSEVNYSAPLTITTSKWGDLVGHCAVIPCTPPDGVVNITTDVTACLDKFRNLEGAVLKSRADVEPNFPDGLVNISDITYVLDAFRGFAYPAAQTPPAPGWPGPDGCP